MVATHKMLSALGLGIGVLLASCGGGQEAGDPTKVDDPGVQEGSLDGTQMLSVGGRLFSIPSPVQTAYAIRKAGLAYNKDGTTPLDKGDAVANKSSQAMLLGMYGADMAYVTVHGDGQRAMATMQAIEKLAAKLELSNAFDRELVDRFRNNLGTEDSLLQFSGAAFRAADQYLKNNERDDVSAMVLAGGWIGSMHLSLSDPAAAANQEIIDRVGEQRSSLNGLVEILGSMDLDDGASRVRNELKKLASDFDAVSSTYTYEKPVTNAAARTTFINSTSTISIPAERLEAIRKKVEAIRNMILA
jgi:hypothetical protein